MMGYSAARRVSIASRSFTTPAAELALQELTRRKPDLEEPHTPPDVEAIIVELSLDRPAWMAKSASPTQLRKLGHSISPAGVRGVWQRHDLETMKKRLKALEAKVAQEGLVLTESQLAALEKAKSEKEAHGEFESEDVRAIAALPGYVLRRQYMMKGVGRIYQQTFIDTYATRSPTPSSMIARRTASPRLISSTIASLPFYMMRGR